MAAQRKHDIVVFGATSFVGQILCKYLVDRHGSEGETVKWAIAGRNAQKLDAVAESTGADVPRSLLTLMMPTRLPRSAHRQISSFRRLGPMPSTDQSWLRPSLKQASTTATSRVSRNGCSA